MSKQVLFNADAGGDGVRLIAEATASGTYRDTIWKIASTVVSYVSGLSDDDKARAFVVLGGFIYRFNRATSSGAGFGAINTTTGDMNVIGIYFATTKASCSHMRITGLSMTLEDRSGTSASGVIKFYAP